MAIVAFPYAQRYSVLALLLLGTCVMSPLARAAASDVAATGDAGDQPAEIDSGGDGGNDSVDYWIWVHGILMSVGWVALLPLGALLAQSRWLAGLRSKVANKEAWFWAHMGCQVLGVLCVTAGFAIAYSDATGMAPEDSDGPVINAHKVLGTIVFAFVLLQAVFGLIRPHPGTPKRPMWNLFHHNWGRLTILLAWINIWLAVAWWHYNGNMNFLAWVVPLAVFEGLLVFIYVGGLFVPKSSQTAALEDTEKAATDGQQVIHSRA